jgi:hypothetical protein
VSPASSTQAYAVDLDRDLAIDHCPDLFGVEDMHLVVEIAGTRHDCP